MELGTLSSQTVADYRCGTSANECQPKPAPDTFNNHRSFFHEVFAFAFCGLKFRQDLDAVRQPSVRSELDDCVVSLEKREPK